MGPEFLAPKHVEESQALVRFPRPLEERGRRNAGFPEGFHSCPGLLPSHAGHGSPGVRAVLHSFLRISIHKGTSVRGLRKGLGAGPGGKAGKSSFHAPDINLGIISFAPGKGDAFSLFLNATA